MDLLIKPCFGCQYILIQNWTSFNSNSDDDIIKGHVLGVVVRCCFLQFGAKTSQIQVRSSYPVAVI